MTAAVDFIIAEVPGFIEDLHPLAVFEYRPVGSRWTCDPAPTNTDEDILVLLEKSRIEDQPDTLDFAKYVLTKAGWECSAEYEQERWGEAPFLTARKDEKNLIIYADPVGFGLFLGAARVSKHLNVTDKPTRVMLHRAATEHDFFDKQ